MRVTEFISSVEWVGNRAQQLKQSCTRGDISQEEFKGLTSLTGDKESKILIPSNLDGWESSNTIKKN